MRSGRIRKAFTLIELLVVIAIIALLLSIMIPGLQRAKDVAKSIVCRTRLKSLGMANKVYASDWNWYVPVIDTTMTSNGEPTWNSNETFRDIVDLNDKDTGSSFKMSKDYLCPSDTQSTDKYFDNVNIPYKNYVSYGYNFTDWWGFASTSRVIWAGPIPSSNWACRLKDSGQITTASQKVMFLDAGDIWAVRDDANYKEYWNELGQDIAAYKNLIINAPFPTYYRHNDSVNVVFFDGHAEQINKKRFFLYENGGLVPDDDRNNRRWFCDPSNIAP